MSGVHEDGATVELENKACVHPKQPELWDQESAGGWGRQLAGLVPGQHSRSSFGGGRAIASPSLEGPWQQWLLLTLTAKAANVFCKADQWAPGQVPMWALCSESCMEPRAVLGAAELLSSRG